MAREESTKGPPHGASRDAMDSLLRKLRLTLLYATVIPLVAISVFIFIYVPTEVLETRWIVAILAAVLMLILAGLQKLFRLISEVAQAAHRDEAAVSSLHPDLTPGQAIPGRRSIRHTVAEAMALIGAIPLLALGYVVVRYVLWVKTTESVLLIACIVAAVIILGVVRIHSLTRRIISVAAAARSVSMEARAPTQDFGSDEIGTLSADLVHISENLSTRLSELRRARGFVERLPHPMLVVDAAGTINFANEAALSLLNYEERELVGTGASSLFVRDEEPGWILGESGDAARENAWRRKDGTLVPVSARIGALSADRGGGSVLIVTDLSERTRAEENLVMFRELINRSSENLSIIDMETGRFLYANNTTCASTGYEQNELMTMRVCDIDPSATETWDPAKERARRAERPILLREGLIKKKDGTTFPVEISSSIVCLAGGEYMVATARDITDRKQAEGEALRLRNQLAHVSRVASLGVLVASLAHEINQPLAAILNNAQASVKFLENDPPDMGEVRGALEDIIADDYRASEVIRKLRSMLKKTDREWQALEINTTIAEVLSLVRRESRARGIPIVSELAPGLPRVRGDGIQLQQVLLNLLLNAFEAMEDSAGDSRIIFVRTASEGDKGVRVSVHDSGHGIKAENMPLLFEPFFTTKRGGLGMGLPINKTIVEAHGGRLWGENNTDRGATFHVVLPAAKEGRT